MVWVDASGKAHPVKTPADWAKRRADILAGMREVMGPLPPPSRKVPLDVRVEGIFEAPKFTRKKISFATERDCRVPAYLFLPKGARGKAPAILCPHPTSDIGKGRPAGLGGPYSRHYALHLAERGYVTLAPDYVRFAEYKWDPYAHGYVSATMKGIWDHMRAVDLLCSLPQVDAERIATIGHSLGGHNSMFVAVFDPRIKAIVSSCGFNAFRRYMKGDLTGWSHQGYMPKIPSYGGWRGMPFDFHEVVAALAPRPFFVNAPLKDANFEVRGVTEAFEAARPVYRLLGAPDAIKVVHPDCGHDFPDDVREQVYAWLDRELNHSKR
ncbi:MAG: prolyl oligopeptidase family serine peptidase [Phycisphaerae bacterium]|nr:prolyl oligopeptidase family serine peptidase [Phycisphaerae bacterium]